MAFPQKGRRLQSSIVDCGPTNDAYDLVGTAAVPASVLTVTSGILPIVVSNASKRKGSIV